MTGRDMDGTQNMIDGTKDIGIGTRDAGHLRAIGKRDMVSRDTLLSTGHHGDGTCALGPPARAPIPPQTNVSGAAMTSWERAFIRGVAKMQAKTGAVTEKQLQVLDRIRGARGDSVDRLMADASREAGADMSIKMSHRELLSSVASPSMSMAAAREAFYGARADMSQEARKKAFQRAAKELAADPRFAAWVAGSKA